MYFPVDRIRLDCMDQQRLGFLLIIPLVWTLVCFMVGLVLVHNAVCQEGKELIEFLGDLMRQLDSNKR